MDKLSTALEATALGLGKLAQAVGEVDGLRPVKDERAAADASSQAHSLERIAESLERALPVLAYIHVQLGNIHQTLITPDANHEPVTIADMSKHIAGALSSKLGYGELFGLANLTPILAPDPQDYKTEAAYLEALDKFNDFRAQIEADKEQ